MEQNRIGNETEAGRLARVFTELGSRELNGLLCENQERLSGRLDAITWRAEEAQWAREGALI